MQTISHLLDDSDTVRWIRMQKLKTIFAARSYVKARQVRAAPEFAKKIESVAWEISGALGCFAGKAAVRLRDLLSFFRLNGRT